MSRMRIFVNAPLSSLAEQRLNDEIAKVLQNLRIDYYFPQRVLPPGELSSPEAVYSANLQAVSQCDVLLSVIDKPGWGVAFELGVAVAQGKTIVLFRSDPQDYLGKVLEGLWSLTPSRLKATSLEGLAEVMDDLVVKSPPRP